MALKELLFAAIVQWIPPWYPPEKNPETLEQYKARLETIAEAVAPSVPWYLGEKAMAASVLTIWYGETRFAYEVLALGSSRWGQDVGKAKCMGQIHHNKIVTKDEWERLEGATLAATRRCANATMRMVRAMAHYCKVRQLQPESLARVFAAYGSGQGCALSDESRSRGRRWYWLFGKLASYEPPTEPSPEPEREANNAESAEPSGSDPRTPWRSALARASAGSSTWPLQADDGFRVATPTIVSSWLRSSQSWPSRR